MDRKEKIKNLPPSAGVYLMKDSEGTVLYVGKAKNLKKRVSSYFYPNKRLPERLEALIAKVDDITYMPTATEAEALIYENSLIKQLSPRYNVALKDGKSYPMLKLTVNEKFPRLIITRERKDDGAIYYGPYSNAKLLRQALDILKWLFPMRTCAKLPRKVCLNYHIKQCLGPCEGRIDEALYGEIVAELKMFLEGRKNELLQVLTEKMNDASRHERFEEAALLKDRIEILGSMKERSVRYGPLNDIEELKNILGLKKDLNVIEAFDISNTMGKEAVGSMIYFYKGRPRKSEYRLFKIKTVAGIDDYSMMREVVGRRYKRLIEEGSPLPDLILIDGGKGHLGAALGELDKLGISGVPVVGIAKEFEQLYLKDKAEPLILPRTSKALHVLERIRDEAHRFAITYHKKLLSKGMRSSALDGIPGIGEKRKKELMARFGTLASIKEAAMEDLLKVKGINEKIAKNIREHLSK